MKKAMGDRESRLSQWRERILEREQSGISVCAWCANHGFIEQQYYYWCSAVRQEMKSQQCLPCKIMKVELSSDGLHLNCSPIVIRYGSAIVELPRNTESRYIADLLMELK